MSIIHFLTDFRGWSKKLQLTACSLFLNLESLEETVTAVVYFVLKTLVRNFAADLILSSCYTFLFNRSKVNTYKIRFKLFMAIITQVLNLQAWVCFVEKLMVAALFAGENSVAKLHGYTVNIA